MTTHSRIAAFLSTSALCLGLAAAPSAFAANTKTGETKTQAQHKHHKSDKSSAKHAADKSGANHKSGTTTPTK